MCECKDEGWAQITTDEGSAYGWARVTWRDSTTGDCWVVFKPYGLEERELLLTTGQLQWLTDAEYMAYKLTM